MSGQTQADVIVVAAGASRRMDGLDKLLAPIGAIGAPGACGAIPTIVPLMFTFGGAAGGGAPTGGGMGAPPGAAGAPAGWFRLPMGQL